ncbi:MAG: CubicO group peptidase (beta-lactamase class C family) [Halieaceae bacterium]|jgi:CubicO group peptidase (beta-lactamase class C family)
MTSLLASSEVSSEVLQQRIRDLVERGRRAIEEGPLTAMQFAVARDGVLLHCETLGAAEPDSRFCIFSCTKPLVAALVWQLLDEGLVALSSTIASIIPEFGSLGKEQVTLEQVLCHTAGFPHAPMGPRHWWDSQSRCTRMGEWRLNWAPGTRFEYHSTSAHWVLAEVIAAVLKQDYREALQQRILAPLGLSRFQLGVPLSEQEDINDICTVGKAPTPREVKAILGFEMDFSELGHPILLRYNEPEVRALGVPGAGGISTAADLAIFYQALLGHHTGLWSDQLLADVTGAVRVNLPDPGTGVPVNRSLGLVVKGDDEHNARRGMGRTCSYRTFGHNGVGGQVAWADPESGISFCLLGNGLDANPIRSACFGISMSNRAALLNSPY